MKQNLKASIVKIVGWKQLAHECDKLNALPWHLPKVAATGAQIVEAERCMGKPFSAPYREFLTLANGWKGFIVSTDLFGTEDFQSGRALAVRNRPDVQEYMSSLELAERDVVPIGASDADMDVFLLISESSPERQGEVLWLAGFEIDKFKDFKDFFESMVNYNADLAKNMKL